MAHVHGRWRLRRRAPSPHGLDNCPGHSCGAIGVCAVSNAIKPFPVTHQHIFNVIRTYLDESDGLAEGRPLRVLDRSEEHTSELQSLMRISYAVFCLNKKKSQI